MWKVIEKIFDLKEFPTKLFLLFTIVSGTLLFAPQNYLINLHLDKFESEYGKYFGIIFLISTGIILLNFFIWVFRYVQGRFLKIKYKNFAIKSLNDLDQYEQGVLREFYIRKTNSLELPYDDATVKGLINKRILIRISNMGELKVGGFLMPMKINDLIKSKIDENILGTSKFNLDDEKFEFMRSNRPEWVNEINRYNNLFNRFF